MYPNARDRYGLVTREVEHLVMSVCFFCVCRRGIVSFCQRLNLYVYFCCLVFLDSSFACRCRRFRFSFSIIRLVVAVVVVVVFLCMCVCVTMYFSHVYSFYNIIVGRKQFQYAPIECTGRPRARKI